MDNLGVAINDTTLQIYAQENGLGKLETTQQKVSAAMQMFLEKTEYAAGNYAKENDTFSGSLTTMKAQLENLSAELGTTLLPTATSLLSMARGALQVVSPMVVSLGKGINSVGQYLMGLSPSAKTMLAVAVGAAVAIPMATKAQLLYNAANGAWKSLLGVLVPKQLTWNSALKATFGWLAIIAGVLSLVASVGAKRREMESDEGKAMKENAEGAEKASDSVDDLAESYEGLGANADAAKRSLADIDTLNIFGGSSGGTAGVDFSAIADEAGKASDEVAAAADGIGDLRDELDDLNGFSLDGLADTFSTTIGDIVTGFGTMWTAFFGEGDEQYEALKVLNEKVKGLFGEDWTNFWNKAGATLYDAFSGEVNEVARRKALTDIQDYLQDIEDIFENGPLGGFFTKWNEFWEGVGASLVPENEQIVKRRVWGVENSDEHREGSMAGRMRGVESSDEHREGSMAGRMRGVENSDTMPNYQRYPPKLLKNLATVAPGLPSGFKPLESSHSAEPMIINVHSTIEMDGDVVGESVTSYQQREAARTGGY